MMKRDWMRRPFTASVSGYRGRSPSAYVTQSTGPARIRVGGFNSAPQVAVGVRRLEAAERH